MWWGVPPERSDGGFTSFFSTGEGRVETSRPLSPPSVVVHRPGLVGERTQGFPGATEVLGSPIILCSLTVSTGGGRWRIHQGKRGFQFERFCRLIFPSDL